MKNYFLALMCFLALGFAPSCKDDEEDAANCAAEYAAAYTAASNSLTAAITTYYAISSPTAADCTTLKAAYDTYIDVLEDFDSCSGFTAQQQADLDQLIQAAEDSRDTAC